MRPASAGIHSPGLGSDNLDCSNPESDCGEKNRGLSDWDDEGEQGDEDDEGEQGGRVGSARRGESPQVLASKDLGRGEAGGWDEEVNGRDNRTTAAVSGDQEGQGARLFMFASIASRACLSPKLLLADGGGRKKAKV